MIVVRSVGIGTGLLVDIIYIYRAPVGNKAPGYPLYFQIDAPVYQDIIKIQLVDQGKTLKYKNK